MKLSRHEKTPRNKAFQRGNQSDTDGTRTRNHRIDSPSGNLKSTNEKPVNGESDQSCLSGGLSKICDTQLQDWLDTCPISLSETDRLLLIRLIQTAEQGLPEG